MCATAIWNRMIYRTVCGKCFRLLCVQCTSKSIHDCWHLKEPIAIDIEQKKERRIQRISLQRIHIVFFPPTFCRTEKRHFLVVCSHSSRFPSLSLSGVYNVFYGRAQIMCFATGMMVVMVGGSTATTHNGYDHIHQMYGLTHSQYIYHRKKT